LPAGAKGTILYAYNDGEAYDVEFDEKVGVTHVATLAAENIEPLVMEPAVAVASTPAG
jgi:hypothetical protein